jgi:hypothetical protein
VGAFARGYALEVEIFRDLEASGVQFAAHDLSDRHQRFSSSDLTISKIAGDIKTSVYFVQAAMPLTPDCCGRCSARCSATSGRRANK